MTSPVNAKVSIPNGSIKMLRVFVFDGIGKDVSIPNGSIKIENPAKDIANVKQFQFQMVRLKLDTQIKHQSFSDVSIPNGSIKILCVEFGFRAIEYVSIPNGSIKIKPFLTVDTQTDFVSIPNGSIKIVHRRACLTC